MIRFVMTEENQSAPKPAPSDAQLFDELLEILDLKQLSELEFEGVSKDFVGPRVFGGQVLGQAVVAASHTTDRPCHSMHAYFLRGGDIRESIRYVVTKVRDGRTLHTRQINAYQKDKLIFTAMASFASKELGMNYQAAAPKVDAPEDYATDLELLGGMPMPSQLRDRVMRPRYVQIKPLHPNNPFKPEKLKPHQAIYMRAHNAAHKELTPAIHQGLLAFMTDYMLLGTCLLPHGISFWSGHPLQAATIDHTIHFHRSFDATRWLLHDMKSDVTAATRGLAQGQIWQDGKLVVSTQQEGLIRLKED